MFASIWVPLLCSTSSLREFLHVALCLQFPCLSFLALQATSSNTPGAYVLQEPVQELALAV